MKIAYLINQYPKVSHSFIRREIAALEALGIQIHRFALRSCQEELIDPADLLEASKTQAVLALPLSQLFVYTLIPFLYNPLRWVRVLLKSLAMGQQADRGLLYHLAYFVEACVILRWCRHHQITHIHAHFGTNSTTVALLCSQLGSLTYSFTAHGPEEFDRPAALNLQQKIQAAAFVVAISSFGRSQLYRLCDHEQWPKIKLIRCGLEDQFLQPNATPFPQEPQLVCVGRLCEQKGQILLLEAMQKLVQEHKTVKLRLVGDGPLRPLLETLIHTYGLQDHVEITGWANSEAVKHWISQARALVLPSFAEGLPVAIMEAMGLGRPVVSTYVAGIPELVNPKINGWLVPAGSVEDLVSALKQVLQASTTDLAQMGQAGRQIVRIQHSVEQTALSLAQLFICCCYSTCGSMTHPLGLPATASETVQILNAPQKHLHGVP